MSKGNAESEALAKFAHDVLPSEVEKRAVDRLVELLPKKYRKKAEDDKSRQGKDESDESSSQSESSSDSKSESSSSRKRKSKRRRSSSTSRGQQQPKEPRAPERANQAVNTSRLALKAEVAAEFSVIAPVRKDERRAPREEERRDADRVVLPSVDPATAKDAIPQWIQKPSRSVPAENKSVALAANPPASSAVTQEARKEPRPEEVSPPEQKAHSESVESGPLAISEAKMNSEKEKPARPKVAEEGLPVGTEAARKEIAPRQNDDEYGTGGNTRYVGQRTVLRKLAVRARSFINEERNEKTPVRPCAAETETEVRPMLADLQKRLDQRLESLCTQLEPRIASAQTGFAEYSFQQLTGDRLGTMVDQTAKSIQGALDRECVRRNREKSDTSIKLVALEEQMRTWESSLRAAKEGISNVASVIPYLVEDAYIQSLLDLNLSPDPKEEIKYRDQLYTRAELVKLKTKLLNSSWNAAAVKEPWRATGLESVPCVPVDSAATRSSCIAGQRRSFSGIYKTGMGSMSTKSGRKIVYRNCDFSSSECDARCASTKRSGRLTECGGYIGKSASQVHPRKARVNNSLVY